MGLEMVTVLHFWVFSVLLDARHVDGAVTFAISKTMRFLAIGLGTVACSHLNLLLLLVVSGCGLHSHTRSVVEDCSGTDTGIQLAWLDR